MSTNLEFEDKNVEMAIKKACKELNIPKEKLKHDVISYGSTGIFGLVGTKKARIRVILPESIPTEATDTSETRQKKKRFVKPDTKNAEQHVATINDEREIETLSADAKHIGRDALQRIIDFITTDATIEIDEKPDRILCNVKGGNPAVLIGKHGQTLEAIQYLVEKIVNKGQENRVRIQVDVEDYLENRRKNLQSLAVRMAEKVRRSGKPATIGQMNAHDRRIVHIALKDDKMVRTQSMGEGLLRKLVIFPKKNFSRKRRQ
jgi:spoIIIJ-associated protein